MTQGVPAAFFSYCREDSDFALRLAGDLKAAGASVWLDQLDIVPGQRWDRAVEDALATCQRMVAILTPAAVNSTNVMDEVSFALEEGKTVIPVISKDCTVPFRSRRVQYVDFRQDYARGLKELLKTLSPELEAPKIVPAISDIPSRTQVDVADADRREHAAEEERRGDPEERKQAVEQERLDLERERAADQARLENKAQQVAESARLEEERKRAAERAHLEQERKQAAEKARLEEEHRKAEEQAMREQERETAEERHQQVELVRHSVAVEEQQPPEHGEIKASVSSRSGLFSTLPVWAKVVVASCGILTVALIVYWVWTRQSASGHLLATLQGHTNHVSSAEFSPDGQSIVTASEDGTARVWNAASGQPLATLQGHTNYVDGAMFSSDGQHIVTASGDHTARVWDAASGQLLAVLRGHTDVVFSAEFSPDGQRIVTASADGTARVWNAASGHLLATLKDPGSLESTEFSPDGQRIVTASWDHTARVWNASH